MEKYFDLIKNSYSEYWNYSKQKMKYFSIFLASILISSCCSTKPISNNTSKLVVMAEPPSPIVETTSETTTENIPNTPIETSTVPEQDNVETVIEANPEDEAFWHTDWDFLLKKNVSDQGNVNYKGFKKDAIYLRNYIQSLSENMPNQDWSEADVLAYWINAYNAMTVDLIIRNYPIKSIKDIKNPWEQRLWKLGAKWYNLDEIEHQILRKMNEPRIHFAIVCASFSCPKLSNNAYNATNLENQLTEATRGFLTDPNRNSITKDRIEISKIFQWFSADFKQNGTLIDFLNTYSVTHISSDAKTRYAKYNWDLNE
jgi:hypothetical protein